mmetsp:Transcript_19078/g.51277  ORF Transcript_19078/g.51277 Transcript_19078/m.51277 type:complete len:286 (+) Transcript_19078:240-1097(+)
MPSPTPPAHPSPPWRTPSSPYSARTTPSSHTLASSRPWVRMGTRKSRRPTRRVSFQSRGRQATGSASTSTGPTSKPSLRSCGGPSRAGGRQKMPTSACARRGRPSPLPVWHVSTSTRLGARLAGLNRIPSIQAAPLVAHRTTAAHVIRRELYRGAHGIGDGHMRPPWRRSRLRIRAPYTQASSITYDLDRSTSRAMEIQPIKSKSSVYKCYPSHRVWALPGLRRSLPAQLMLGGCWSAASELHGRFASVLWTVTALSGVTRTLCMRGVVYSNSSKSQTDESRKEA